MSVDFPRKGEESRAINLSQGVAGNSIHQKDLFRQLVVRKRVLNTSQNLLRRCRSHFNARIIAHEFIPKADPVAALRTVFKQSAPWL